MKHACEAVFLIWLLGALAYCIEQPQDQRHLSPAWPVAIYKELWP